MSMLRISLFGHFQVLYDNQAVSGLEATKVQELFSYLLLNRGSLQSRETLAGLLWGESSTTQSRRYLRQALWQLNNALPMNDGQLRDQLLHSDPNSISLIPVTSLWLDVATFEEAFSLIKNVPARSLDIREIEILEQGVQLYSGDLLEGWYQDWCLFERERLQNMYLTMLEKLMNYCEIHQQWESGVSYGMAILHIDRAREYAHQSIMRLLYRSGDRTGALRQYERCVAVLEEELNVSPSQSTSALYRQILDENLFETVQPDSVERLLPAIPTDAVSLPAVLSCLKKFQSMLDDMQRQLSHEIQMIEQMRENKYKEP